MKKLKEVDMICIAGGKCGSTTLLKTFTKNKYNAIKAHSIGDFKKQFGYDGLFDLIDRSSKNKKVYIVDSYRTPIERKISSFFENINHHVPDYKHKNVQQLIDVFNNKYIHILEEYHTINDIMKHYGLQTFDTFDFNNKYIIKKSNNIVFVKLLFSDIHKWNNILSNIFNKKIIMHNGNMTRNKNIYSLYKQFIIKYQVPKIYIINTLINDKQFKIFNTPKTQKLYINKWLQSSF